MDLHLRCVKNCSWRKTKFLVFGPSLLGFWFPVISCYYSLVRTKQLTKTYHSYYKFRNTQGTGPSNTQKLKKQDFLFAVIWEGLTTQLLVECHRQGTKQLFNTKYILFSIKKPWAIPRIEPEPLAWTIWIWYPNHLARTTSSLLFLFLRKFILE